MLQESDALLTLLQICDSGFPTGGFSHSLGLEAALKVETIQGRATNNESLNQFVVCCLENTGSFTLPFMREAQQQCFCGGALYQLDNLCEASTPNHVARRASTRQGRSMLDTSIKVFNRQPLVDLEHLPFKHHPIIFGCLCGILGIDLHSAMTSFLHCSLRTVVAAAVRMDKLGPIEGQSVLRELQKNIPSIIQRNERRASEDSCMMYPHVDIVQNTHDTMFSKLFYS